MLDIKEENHINFDPYLSYTTTKITTEICTGIENVDLLRLYFFMLHDKPRHKARRGSESIQRIKR